MDLCEEKRTEQLKEITDFINSANLTDVFTSKNTFKDKFNCDIYSYLRVSTENQEFSKQILELYGFCKEKDLTIPIENIYFDKYTGKKLDRGGYQNLKLKIGSSDYLIVSDLSRLGRDWDNTKQEWEWIQSNDINVILQDNELLSAPLPTEKKPNATLEYKFIQSLLFMAMNYTASLKIEQVRRDTKNGLKKARLKGKRLGKPVGKYTSVDNFIETLKLQVEDGTTTAQALRKTRFPKATYFEWLRKYKERDDSLTDKTDVYNFVKASHYDLFLSFND